MTGKLNSFLKKIEPWHVLLGVIVSALLGILGAKTWINNTAQDAVLDEKFLTTLAGRVRPTCIFDTRGTIEADLGAGAFVENLNVTPNPTNYSFTVYLSFKRHLAYAPLISAIDADLFIETATRGKLHDWVLVMSPNRTVPTLRWSDDAMDTNKVYRFKLEILH